MMEDDDSEKQQRARVLSPEGKRKLERILAEERDLILRLREIQERKREILEGELKGDGKSASV